MAEALRVRATGTSTRFGVRDAAHVLSIACVVVVAMLPVVPALPPIVVGGYFTVTRMALVLGFVAVLVARWGRSDALDFGGVWGAAILAAAAAFTVWFMLAGVLAGGSALPVARLQVEELAALVLVVLAVRTRRDLDIVLFSLATCLVATAALSIWQVVARQPTGFAMLWLGGWRAVQSDLSMPGGDILQPTAIVRPVAFFNNPNVLASWIVLVAPLCAALAGSRKAPRAFTVVLGVLVVSVLALTMSRGAALAAVAAVILVVSIRKRAGLALVLAPLLVVGLLGMLSENRASSALKRLEIWRLAGRMVAEHPMFGVGPGHFVDVAQYLGYGYGAVWHAHNTVLNIAAEAGLPAAVLFLSAIVLAFGVSIQLARTQRDSPYGLALSAAIAAFAIVSLFDNAYNVHAVSSTLWIAVALVIVVWRLSQSPSSAAEEPGDHAVATER